MTEILERMARERADFLGKQAKELRREAVGFLVFARENCNFVATLGLVWQALLLRLPGGGVPLQPFVGVCDLLLKVLTNTGQHLDQLLQEWEQRDLPDALAESLRHEVESSLARVHELLTSIQSIRAEIAAAPRGVSADPEALKRRLKQTGANDAWSPMWAKKE